MDALSNCFWEVALLVARVHEAKEHQDGVDRPEQSHSVCTEPVCLTVMTIVVWHAVDLSRISLMCRPGYEHAQELRAHSHSV